MELQNSLLKILAGKLPNIISCSLKIQMLPNCQTPSQLSVWTLFFSCSLLIIEHGTQKDSGPSVSHRCLSQKKKKTTKALLGSPTHDAEAGFSLGGPATDRYGTDARLSRHSSSSSSLAGDECVRTPATVRLCDTDSDCLICPSCLHLLAGSRAWDT